MGAEDEYLWCRVEEERGGASRVNIMHPDGEILFSLPPEHFEPELVRRMQVGQVRARLSQKGQEGGPFLTFLDESGRAISSEDVLRRSHCLTTQGESEHERPLSSAFAKRVFLLYDRLNIPVDSSQRPMGHRWSRRS
ncbi:MAG TPA: hypothetical protein VEO02_01090 [Thermoanaerobaculia bacterium]|nr:hypothetical protein [Thermoanaerobaculia bacterium]